MDRLVFQFLASDGKKKNLTINRFGQDFSEADANAFLDAIESTPIVKRGDLEYYNKAISARIVTTETKYLVQREV